MGSVNASGGSAIQFAFEKASIEGRITVLDILQQLEIAKVGLATEVAP